MQSGTTSNIVNPADTTVKQVTVVGGTTVVSAIVNSVPAPPP